MVNPYFCYSISFLFALLTYLLGWSDLYPPLSAALIGFLSITIGVHAWMGGKFALEKKVVFTALPEGGKYAPLFVTLFLYALWTLDFLYEGGIPLVKILLKQPYNYRLFGIPSLHVFIVTFSSFYTVYLFHLYLSSRRKSVLFFWAINLFAAILIYSRAMFFFNLAGCFLLFLLQARNIPRYVLGGLPFVFLILFYFFGVLGTLRVAREAEKEYDSSLFLEIGKASTSFQRSPVPKEYFWTYVYVSSPLANLQKNIDSWRGVSPRIGRLGEMINNEILMDFMSKRINAFLHLEREKEYTIPGPFNVSTVYSRSFSYLGWNGMAIMALVILLAPLGYMKVVSQNSPFFLTGFVILCTMFLFLAYDNTLRFTGLSFQLVYPVFLPVAWRWFPGLRRIFL